MGFQHVGENLQADETITKVARESRFITLMPFDEAALWLLAQVCASPNVFATSDRMDKDLPMPISSARMPPPVSGC